jgi:hypothetical protein
VQRVARAGDGIEGPRPVGLELAVHQALGKVRVAEPRESMVPAVEVRPTFLRADIDVGVVGLRRAAHH